MQQTASYKIRGRWCARRMEHRDNTITNITNTKDKIKISPTQWNVWVGTSLVHKSAKAAPFPIKICLSWVFFILDLYVFLISQNNHRTKLCKSNSEVSAGGGEGGRLWAWLASWGDTHVGASRFSFGGVGFVSAALAAGSSRHQKRYLPSVLILPSLCSVSNPHSLAL